MEKKFYVVAFPSVFARRNVPLLMRNIRKALKAAGMGRAPVGRDGPVITIEAAEPVMASSAVAQLFGIERVIIARQVKNDFDVAATVIAEVGASLLLKGDRFLVKVEGEARGFLPRDLEMAATSAIIGRSAERGAGPGTEEDHNRQVYAFLTKAHAYVSIFSDKGLGGAPHGVHKRTVLCPVFDELSAVSCMAALRQGFDVRMIMCYSKESELAWLAKIANRIIPRTAEEEVELAFYKLGPRRRGRGYPGYLRTVMNLAGRAAAAAGITHVSLPASPLIIPAEEIDGILGDLDSAGIAAYMPLGGLEEMEGNAREIGIEGLAGRIGALAWAGPRGSTYDKARIDSLVDAALAGAKSVCVMIGPNNVHDILDGLEGE
ncbi:thiamine biosynthesis protein [Cenarchaeum symbiosum A]|uniref:Thiamine biosynthesis protein n=1 Tax=Cenarchaeum symbiosum (strain A) TaxID=414004 RepID=A0RYU4_CENSY|nr:thiamine biosynthesis protein [Cenarchaeum symbiosum A]